MDLEALNELSCQLLLLVSRDCQLVVLELEPILGRVAADRDAIVQDKRAFSIPISVEEHFQVDGVVDAAH